MSSTLPPNATLAEAKQWLRDRVGKGETCPCCTQFAKVYKNRLNSSMAYALILVERAPPDICEGGYLHVPSYLNACGLPPRISAAIRGHWAKLVHWGLLEPAPGEREDGSKRTGYWRITPQGRDFVRGRSRVPASASIYDSRCLKLSSETVSIREALGEHFNYDELMNT